MNFKPENVQGVHRVQYTTVNIFPAFFPLEVDEYPVVFFLGGLNTYVIAEFYSTVLSDIASHGFFVFGVDYEFPVYDDGHKSHKPSYGKQDIDKFFKQLTWVI
jgi:hypothetical protein